MNSPRLATWLEQTWLACYLDRQLTKDEAAWFEAYILDKPELLAAIDLDSTLRDALAVGPGLNTGFETERSAESESAAALESDKYGLARGLPSRRHRIVALTRSWRMRLGTAVAVSSIVGLGAGWYGNGHLRGSARSTVVASPTRIVFDRLRDGPVRPRIEHADSASAYDVVEVALPPGAKDVSLHLGSEPARKLSPAPDGFVSFLLDREILKKPLQASVRYSWRDQRVTLPLDFSAMTEKIE